MMAILQEVLEKGFLRVVVRNIILQQTEEERDNTICYWSVPAR
jgi:hypothetical protein